MLTYLFLATKASCYTAHGRKLKKSIKIIRFMSKLVDSIQPSVLNLRFKMIKIKINNKISV